MAQQTTVRFVDDLDGSDAAGTFDFAIDGRQYQIDLSDENATKLRDALAPYVGAARRPVAVPADARFDRPRWRTSPRGATATRRPRSAIGRAPTVTRSATAVASPSRSWTPIRPRTDRDPEAGTAPRPARDRTARRAAAGDVHARRLALSRATSTPSPARRVAAPPARHRQPPGRSGSAGRATRPAARPRGVLGC